MQKMLKMSESSTRSRSAGVWGVLLSVMILCLSAATAGAASQPTALVSQISYLSQIGSGGQGAGGYAGGSFAVNQLGDVIVSNEWGNTLYLINGQTGAETVLGSWGNVGAVAVDAQNNFYVADIYSPTIVKVPYVNGAYAAFNSAPSGSCTGNDTVACTIPNLTFSADGWWFGTQVMAVDPAGNLYIGLTNSNTLKNGILECNAACKYGSGSPKVVFTEPTATPQLTLSGLSFDANNNLYISDYAAGNPNSVSNVWELPYTAGTGFAANTTLVLSVTSAKDYINSVASDAAGNLYLAYANSGVYVLPGGNTSKEYAISGQYAVDLTVDAKGNVYSVFWSSAFGGGNFGVGKISVNNVEIAAAAVGGTATTNSNISVFENGVSCGTANPTITFTAWEDGASSTEFTGSVPAVVQPTPPVTPALTTTCVNTVTGSYNPVTITFTPTLVGGRRAVLSVDDTTNTLTVNAIAHGVGQGPLATTDPASAGILTGTGFVAPASVVVDAAGDVFVADPSAKKVFEIAMGTTTPVAVGTGFSEPMGLALDAYGDLFVADASNADVVEIANTATTGGFTAGAQTTLVSSSVMFGGAALSEPVSLAFDGHGVLYIQDDNTNGQIDTYNTFTGATGVFAANTGDASQIAVDDWGNVYVAVNSGTVTEFTPSGITVLSSIPGAANPNGVAVEASGSVIVSDQATGNIVRIPNENGTLTVADAILIDKNAGSGEGLALDTAGNLYAADGSSADVVDYMRSTASVDFGKVDDTDLSSAVNIYLESAGNTAVTLSSPVFAPLSVTDFTLAAASSNGCTAGSTGPAGRYCVLLAQFAPGATDSGAISTSTTVATDALNSATLTVNLAGTAIPNLVKQNVAFTSPTLLTYTYGAAPITLVTTSGASGNPVVLSVDALTTGYGSVSAPTGIASLSGSVLTITGAGTIVIDANQAGDQFYAAGQAQLTLTVLPIGIPPTVAASVASGGTVYISNQVPITLTSDMASAVFYYTLTSGATGTTPTHASTVYVVKTGIPLPAAGTWTLEAIATAWGYVDSAPLSVTFTVGAIPPNFTLAATNGAVSLSNNQVSVQDTVTVTPLNGFSAEVDFTCQVPEGQVSCTFTPASVTPTGGAKATTSLTINTVSGTASLHHNNSNPFLPAGATLATVLCFFGFRKRRNLQMLLLLAVSFVALGVCTGCNSTYSGPINPPSQVTVLVTGTSGTLQQTADIVVTLQQN